MLTCIPQVLRRDEVRCIFDVRQDREFVDGELPVGALSRKVKRNLAYKRPNDKPTKIDRIVDCGRHANRMFRDLTLPNYIATPIISKEEPGMEYGLHGDTPLVRRRADR